MLRHLACKYLAVENRNISDTRQMAGFCFGFSGKGMEETPAVLLFLNDVLSCMQKF